MNNFDSNLETSEYSDFLTVVVVTFNRTELLRGMLLSLKRSVDCRNIKIKIGINGQDLSTLELLEYIKNSGYFENFEIFQIENNVTPGEARNLTSQNVQSQWILFLDDDIEVPEKLISNFLYLAEQNPDVVVWGGPNLTPEDSSLVEKKIGWLLENAMIVGPVSNRYKKSKKIIVKANEFHLSLCNLFVKKKLFEKIFFNPTLKTAEENELLYKIMAEEHRISSSPLLFVWHYRRSSFSQFLKQIKNYGFGRGQILFGLRQRIKISLVFILFILMTIVTLFPIQTVKFLAIWMLLILLSYFLSFKKKSLSFLFLPVRVWINYFVGVANGLWFSYKNIH